MSDPYQEAFEDVLAREKARKVAWVVTLVGGIPPWHKLNWRARWVTLVDKLEDGRVVIEHRNGVRVAKRPVEVFFNEKEAIAAAKANFVP